MIEVLHEGDFAELNTCKGMLKKLMANLKTQHEDNDPVIVEFETQFVVAHLMATRFTCAEKKLSNLVARISVALLR